MKSGLLVYKSYDNIFNVGDYVQSLAASQHFNENIDIFVNRESLNEYSDEELKIILNGWFMHEPEQWPPSDQVKPLFISFHINSVAKDLLLESKSIDFLKKFEPIGCRDRETARLLKEKGVDAFFSGCLTLTLGKTYKSKEPKSDEVYFVDPYFEFKTDFVSIIKYGLTSFKNLRLAKRISLSLFGSSGPKSIIKSGAFLDEYSQIFSQEVLVKAIYVTQLAKESDFNSDVEKFDFAKDLLKKYSTAKFVVTSRIHCALPCLAIETPVIYIENENQSETSYCRLDGLRQLFNIVSYNKGKMSFKFPFPGPKVSMSSFLINKDNYKELRDSLITKCENFMQQRTGL